VVTRTTLGALAAAPARSPSVIVIGAVAALDVTAAAGEALAIGATSPACGRSRP